MTKREKYKAYIEIPTTNMSEFQVMVHRLTTSDLRELKGLLSRDGGNKMKLFHINSEIKKREPRVTSKRPWPIELDYEWEAVCKPFRQLKQEQQRNENA